MMVLDASALLEVLLRTPAGVALEPDLFCEGESLHAPGLIDLEVLQVFRRYLRHREIQEARLTEALEDLVDFPLTRYPHEPLVGRVWDLRSRMTAYDAAYVALAEALDAPLVTFDARLARTTGHDAAIRFAGRR